MCGGGALDEKRKKFELSVPCNISTAMAVSVAGMGEKCAASAGERAAVVEASGEGRGEGWKVGCAGVTGRLGAGTAGKVEDEAGVITAARAGDRARGDGIG